MSVRRPKLWPRRRRPARSRAATARSTATVSRPSSPATRTRADGRCHDRLREIRLTPGVRRWWQDPPTDWPDDGDGAAEYTVLLEDENTVLLEDEIIGFAQWHAEDEPMFRHAGLDLFLDPAVHGRGLETARVLCAHLIDDHAFHRLVIDPEVANTIAIGAYAKLGFRPVGVMGRYSRDRFGTWKDGLLLDLLAEEFIREG